MEGRLRAEGFRPFEVELGGRGVGVLEPVEAALIEDFESGIGEVASEDKAWKYWN